MLTSDSDGRSTPASAAAVSGLVLRVATSPEYSSRTPLMLVSVSWPANSPSCSASLTQGLQARRLLGGDVGEVHRVGDGALEQVVGHLLGDLQGDVLLRLRRWPRPGAACRSRWAGRTAGCPWPAPPRTRRTRRRRRGRPSAPAASARSSTRPPRAQLMMRTPFLVFCERAASMMLRVLSVSGVCSVMKSARRSRSSSSTFSTPSSMAALRRQERIVGDHLHLQADGAVGDDRADVAAADHAQRLGVELDAHELRLLPLAGLGGAVGLRDLAGQRHHQRDGVLGGGDGVAERRVHDDDALGGRRLDVDVVDADAGAADHLAACWPRR